MFGVLVLVVPLALRLVRTIGPVVDPDIWWHLAAGRWILEHRTVLTVDPFFTAGGREWLNYSWFIDVFLWLSYRTEELAGPVTYAIAMAGLLLLASAALVRREGAQLVRRSFVAGIGFLALSTHLGPRTYLI